MSFQQLYGALSEDALVNYFELVEALDGLESSEHIARDQDEGGGDRYSVTGVGAQAAAEFTSVLPLSVRERALGAAGRLLEREKRQGEVKVDIQSAPGGGFNMTLAIPQEDSALVEFSLFAPTLEQCELIRRRFLNAPSFIYKGVLALLTGNRGVLDELFPPAEEQLF